jgi:hypothetical protein
MNMNLQFLRNASQTISLIAPRPAEWSEKLDRVLHGCMNPEGSQIRSRELSGAIPPVEPIAPRPAEWSEKLDRVLHGCMNPEGSQIRSRGLSGAIPPVEPMLAHPEGDARADPNAKNYRVSRTRSGVLRFCANDRGYRHPRAFGACSTPRIFGPEGQPEISRGRKPPVKPASTQAPEGLKRFPREAPTIPGISAAPPGRGAICAGSGGCRLRLISGWPSGPKRRGVWAISVSEPRVRRGVWTHPLEHEPLRQFMEEGSSSGVSSSIPQSRERAGVAPADILQVF